MKTKLLLLMAVVLSLASAGDAHADIKNFYNYCTTGALKSCVSVQVQTTAFAGGTQVVMKVRNLQGTLIDNTGGGRITAIGLTSPSISGAKNLTVTTEGNVQTGNATPKTPNSFWSITGKPIGGQITFSAESGNGQDGGILGCDYEGGAKKAYFRTCDAQGSTGWVVFSFTTTNTWNASDAQLAWKVQTANGSFECRTGDSPGSDHACAPYDPTPPPVTTTPEPVSMTLLATGLLGVGAARRRRQKGEAAVDPEGDR